MQSRTENNESNPQRNHDSMRPLRNIIIHLQCGCTIPLVSDKEIAPREGLPLWCFTHQAAVNVTQVEYQR